MLSSPEIFPLALGDADVPVLFSLPLPPFHLLRDELSGRATQACLFWLRSAFLLIII